jgi:hypothetical protein
MTAFTFNLRGLKRCSRWACALAAKGVAVTLVGLIAWQSTLPPKLSVRASSPQPQRDSESELPAPEESSKETTPSALYSADVARARRAEAAKLGRCQHIPARTLQAVGSRRIFHAPIPADQASRNGTGCPLRC